MYQMLTQIHEGNGEVHATLTLRCHGQIGYAHVSTLINNVECIFQQCKQNTNMYIP